MDGEVSLLSLRASPFAMGVRIALAVAGIDYTVLEEASFPSKSQLLLKSNPVLKEVPVLIHKGRPVSESLVILSYIQEALVKDDCFLLPGRDPHDRAEARFWANFANTKFWENAMALYRLQGDQSAQAKDKVIDCYRTMDREWSKLQYGGALFGGGSDKLLLPDVVLAPLVSWKPLLEEVGAFRFPGADQCPRMAEWMEAVAQHPAVSSSLTEPEIVRHDILELRDKVQN